MSSEAPHDRRYLYTLALGALGVVYGDIGTSPLYAFKECFSVHHGYQIEPTPQNVLGILSLICWSLILVISIKYVMFVMRADNRGEGGILALMSLVRPKASRRRGILVALGLFGSALLYGEGMITPAITVISAIEGLEVVTPVFTPFVVPITVAVLVIVFTVQKFGTARVGAAYGPLMLIWFAVMAVLGISEIIKVPRVLLAVNPILGFNFLLHHQIAGFLVMGAVFLVVTGGESLYADMGHFGPRPIRMAWFYVVFPALLMNYFGQGALLMTEPHQVENPFFQLGPEWALFPLVILATLAAIVASQAVISGAYSLTRQAVQLGYLPRIRVRHTSAREIGQIYIASINWVLMFCAIGLVLGFRASTNLVGAYGVGVTTTMAITSILLSVVAKERWGWSVGASLAMLIPFIIVDLTFFGANITKIADGGWVPLFVAITVFTLMSTWRRGREILTRRMSASGISTEEFVKTVTSGKIIRVPGTAVFMSRSTEGVPTALLHNLKHNKIVHECVVIVTIEIEETPHLSPSERYEWVNLGGGIFRLLVHFGYMEDPDLPALLEKLGPKPVSFDRMRTSYFLGRETLIPTKQPGMAIWREHIFSWMVRNSSSASQFFSLPANQVIELGAQVEM